MKKYIPYTIILLIGAILGGGLCKSCTDHFHGAGVQTDTTIVYKVVKYSSLDLAAKTIKLDVPKISKPELVFIPEVQTEIVYKDSIRYIVMQREHYFTKTADAEIWHSGVDSRIDSLNVEMKTVVISKLEKATPKLNRIALGLEAGYCGSPYIPVYFEYGRMVHKNIEVYGRVFYDLSKTSVGAGLGVRTSLGW